MTRWRRWVRDYEQRRDAFEAIIPISLGSSFLRRVSHP
jgi:hypothetical protein